MKSIFFVACLVASLHCHSWNTLIRCGTTEKMTMDLPHSPHSLDFLCLPFVPPRSGASFSSCTKLFWKLSGIWNYKQHSGSEIVVLSGSQQGCPMHVVLNSNLHSMIPHCFWFLRCSLRCRASWKPDFCPILTKVRQKSIKSLDLVTGDWVIWPPSLVLWLTPWCFFLPSKMKICFYLWVGQVGTIVT